MKTMNIFSAIFAVALLAVMGCTNRTDRAGNRVDERTDTTTRTETTRNDDKAKRESYQQPGTIDSVKKDIGHETIEVRKQVLTSDTQKETIPTVEEKHVKADINRMSAEEFHKLGLSSQAAANVVQFRHDHGNFHSVEDLRKIPGVSTSWISSMRNQLGYSAG